MNCNGSEQIFMCSVSFYILTGEASVQTFCLFSFGCLPSSYWFQVCLYVYILVMVSPLLNKWITNTCPLDYLFIPLEYHWVRSPYPLCIPFFYGNVLVRFEELLTNPNVTGDIEYVLFLPFLYFLLLDRQFIFVLVGIMVMVKTLFSPIKCPFWLNHPVSKILWCCSEMLFISGNLGLMFLLWSLL